MGLALFGIAMSIPLGYLLVNKVSAQTQDPYGSLPAPVPPPTPGPPIGGVGILANDLFAVTQPATGAAAIWRIDRATGNTTTIPTPEPVSLAADGLAASATSLFFINGFGSNQVTKMSHAGVLQATFGVSGAGAIDGLAFNAGTLYAADFTSNTIISMDPNTGAVLGAVVVAADIAGGLAPGPAGTLFASVDFADVVQIDPATGVVLGTAYTGILGILGLAFDGNLLVLGDGGSTNHLVVDPSTGGVVDVITGLPAVSALAIPPPAPPGGTTVAVPGFTGITVGTSGPVPVDVLGLASGDLGAYQFELRYDPTVVRVAINADVLGGVFPFDGVTAVNVDNTPDPITGLALARWNHFQGGSAPVSTAIHNLANVVFQAVGLPDECSVLDIRVVELVDNGGVAIPNVDQDGQVCLLGVPALAETDLAAAQDVDDPALAIGVKPTIDLIKDPATSLPLPATLIASYAADVTYDPNLAEVTDCRLKPPLDASTCTVDNVNGLVQLAGSGTPTVAPLNPLAFLALRLIGSNDPVTGVATVDLTYTEIKDNLGSVIPQDLPPDSRTFLRGDALTDGGVSISDTLFIGQHLVDPVARPVGEGPGEVNPVNAGSVNHDGPNDVISLADAVLIAQFLVGNLDEFYNPPP